MVSYVKNDGMKHKMFFVLMWVWWTGSLLHAEVSEVRRQYECSILDFGASVDTNIVNTTAINKAIEHCYRQGGGRVIVPAGRFKTGTIFLKDNVELRLENGAYLFASENPDDFPLMPPAAYRSLKDEGGWSALIYAEEARNIALTGYGTLDGRGKGRKGRVGGVAGDANGRPRNLLFISCRNVRVEGVTMQNSALWNQHYLNCEDVTVDNIRVYNHCNGNNDGIDIDGCRRFTLSNSIIDSDDDGIVLKSTGTSACEDIVVTGCIVSSFANAIKCGTESTGGFKNILVADCIVKPSRNKGERIIKSTPSGITAISLEIVDGGIMDGVMVHDIVIEGTECPLYIRLADRGRKHLKDAPDPPMGRMRNIRISNVTAYGTGNFCSSVTGIPDGCIEDVWLDNIRFVNKGGLVDGNFRTPGDMRNRRHDTSGNLFFDKYWASHRDVVEDEKGYPQPTVWGNLPSYGLFVRHVKRLTVTHSAFGSEAQDPRVPLIAVDVERLKIHDLDVPEGSRVQVLMDGVKDYVIDKALKISK